MMMWQIQNGMGWWMLLASVMMILFWAGVIGLVVWGVSKVSGPQRTSGVNQEEPLVIARKRLARGEITAEQFESLRAILAYS